MDEELFPTRTERERMRGVPLTGLERLSSLMRRLRQEGVAALGPRDTRLHPPQVLGTPDNEGGTTLEVPVTDSRRHHPRRIQLCGWDPLATPFWANLVIAGDGNGGAGAGAARKDAAAPPEQGPVSKSEGTLPNAVHDLNSLRYFYNPHRIGDRDIVVPGSLMRSAGYFTHTVWLADPTEAAACTGIESLCHWIDVNAGDPEFRSAQINIYFSGHGAPGERPGESTILLHDGPWRIEALVSALVEGVVRRGTRGENLRVRLFVDSCHAGAIGRDFRAHLYRERARRGEELGFETFWCRTILCSSFADEQSFDEDGLGNSYFTAGFLRENSTRRVPASYPSMAEVSRRSGWKQTPFMLNFPSAEKAPELRLPLLSWLSGPEKAELFRHEDVQRAAIRLVQEKGLVSEDGAVSIVDWAICQGEARRDLLLPRLRSSTGQPPDIVPYERRRTRWDH
ncbi:hypothetical protein VQH23_06645 [Pararoseomonas sp. SCSIO 73927]|uniref:hypothetical protein n=1 Tax=Pararoseomonas sp. SCSIO 73927 TaxID=3114537 RepID=UPI0030D606B3